MTRSDFVAEQLYMTEDTSLKFGLMESCFTWDCIPWKAVLKANCF